MMMTVMLRTALALVVIGAFVDYQPAKSSEQVPVAAPARSIGELSWLAGDWQTAPGGRVQIEEHWTQPTGGTMIGMGRTVAGGKTVEFEYLRLEERAGAIYYVAHPKARCPGTDFKLTSLTAQAAVFENPLHDFPKRIIYRRNTDGSVTASIDGGEGTRQQSFTYLPMKK